MIAPRVATVNRPRTHCEGRCPSIVPELSPSNVYSRRLPSSDSSRKSLSLRFWSTGFDDGSPWRSASNPVGDATPFVTPERDRA